MPSTLDSSGIPHSPQSPADRVAGSRSITSATRACRTIRRCALRGSPRSLGGSLLSAPIQTRGFRGCITTCAGRCCGARRATRSRCRWSPRCSMPEPIPTTASLSPSPPARATSRYSRRCARMAPTSIRRGPPTVQPRCMRSSTGVARPKECCGYSSTAPTRTRCSPRTVRRRCMWWRARGMWRWPRRWWRGGPTSSASAPMGGRRTRSPS